MSNIEYVKEQISKKRTIKENSLRAYLISLQKLSKEEYDSKFNTKQLENFTRNKKHIVFFIGDGN